MKLFQKPNVRNVSDWLETTTRKLAPSAQERIRLEIEAHHAESVAAHLQAGLSKGDAEAAALAELGDVQQAARRFKRQYLTARQAMEMEVWEKSSRSLLKLCISYWLFFMFGVLPARTFLSLSAPRPLLFLVLIASPTIEYCLARRKGGYPTGWFYVLIRSFNLYGLGVFFLFAFGTPPDVDLPNAGLPMARIGNGITAAFQVLFFIRLFYAFRFAKKLHELQNTSQNPVSS